MRSYLSCTSNSSSSFSVSHESGVPRCFGMMRCVMRNASCACTTRTSFSPSRQTWKRPAQQEGLFTPDTIALSQRQHETRRDSFVSHTRCRKNLSIASCDVGHNHSKKKGWHSFLLAVLPQRQKVSELKLLPISWQNAGRGKPHCPNK